MSVCVDSVAGPLTRSLPSSQCSAPTLFLRHSPWVTAVLFPPLCLQGLLNIHVPSRSFSHMNPHHARPSLALFPWRLRVVGTETLWTPSSVSHSCALPSWWWQPCWRCSTHQPDAGSRTRELAPLLFHYRSAGHSTQQVLDTQGIFHWQHEEEMDQFYFSAFYNLGQTSFSFSWLKWIPSPEKVSSASL